MSISPGATRTGSPASDFAAVFGRLEPHLAALDAFLRQQVAGFEPEIRSMAEYCIDTSGKRIRPALVFLSGWREGGQTPPPPDLVRSAAVVELVHLATLVHDDIMDGAKLRRSRQTAGRAYGPEAAVLLGDALFSHALHLAAEFPTTRVCLAVAASTRRVCAGEIVQTLRRRTTSVGRKDYFRIIDLKTAELFRLSCELGSELGGHPGPFVQAAAEFGRRLGVAYQVYDDLADFFGREVTIGKTLGTDLMSGKLTLPLLALADRLSRGERGELMEKFSAAAQPTSRGRIAQMRRFGVFEEVADVIEHELGRAEAALAPHGEEAAVLLCGLADVLRAQVRLLRT